MLELIICVHACFCVYLNDIHKQIKIIRVIWKTQIGDRSYQWYFGAWVVFVPMHLYKISLAVAFIYNAKVSISGIDSFILLVPI